MIYYEYSVWTKNGFEPVMDLIEGSEVLVYNIITRMNKFKQIKNLKKIIYKNNFQLENTINSYIFADKSFLLDKSHSKISLNELTTDKKIFCNATTLWILDEILKIPYEKFFYTFDLDENDFVLVKNSYMTPIYLSWEKEGKILTRGCKNKLK